MKLEQIRVFLEVAELEHVTLASERLHMTQSAVSGALHALKPNMMFSYSTEWGVV